PMTALAALLMIVAWNMSDVGHAVRVIKRAPRSDAAVLVVCFVLTVAVDMIAAVGVGVVLASLLFMRRMVETTEVRVVDAAATPRADLPPLPTGVTLYEIAGP